ncbi:DUF896 domain-containing protein [Oscillospiraceae bacterium LTW-04]|nr:DUF896 domain-containing protein [Oscillospiraceae bacterium MB24-C1]
MEQKKLDRINEFARRVKAGEALSPAELAERDALRREYIESYRRSLVTQLNHTYVVDEQGNKTKLKRKDDDLPPC